MACRIFSASRLRLALRPAVRQRFRGIAASSNEEFQRFWLAGDEEEMAAIEAAFLQVPVARHVPAAVYPEEGPLLASSSASGFVPISQHLPLFCGPTPDRKPILRKCSRTVAADGANCTFSSRSREGHEESSAIDIQSAVDDLSGSNSATMGVAVVGSLTAANGSVGDIEDVFPKAKTVDNEDSERVRVAKVLRRRLESGLAVTDFTALEWCEKQVEFSFTRGKPVQTAAMKAGSARHTELELEVVTKVAMTTETKEDAYAVRLLNFLVGAQQLILEGLTRELPVMGLIEDIWVVGIIDELRLCERNGTFRPLIVDTKTRVRPTTPADPQKRNGRMQLMLYKFLWDQMVSSPFPDDSFMEFFGLDRNQRLSPDVQILAQTTVGYEVSIETLDDFLRSFKDALNAFGISHDTLLLRYEWQADRSLIAEDEFYYQQEWLKEQLSWQLHYYRGAREAGFVPKDELWKCRFCTFTNVCPQFNNGL